jgi:hypothetical protein
VPDAPPLNLEEERTLALTSAKTIREEALRGHSTFGQEPLAEKNVEAEVRGPKVTCMTEVAARCIPYIAQAAIHFSENEGE